eukprot:5798428-Prymnesium_polylepis.3
MVRRLPTRRPYSGSCCEAIVSFSSEVAVARASSSVTSLCALPVSRCRTNSLRRDRYRCNLHVVADRRPRLPQLRRDRPPCAGSNAERDSIHSDPPA